MNEALAQQVIEDWPVAGLEPVEFCPVCGCKERQQLYSNLTDRAFRCAPGRWSLYHCDKCRSAYLNPRPSRDTISLAYRHYYTHEKPKQQYVTAMLPSWRRYIGMLVNGYYNRRYGGKQEPSNSLGAWLIPFLPRLRRRLDRELRYLPKYQVGARLLDVGFGSGQFLHLAKQIGWQVSGVDFDPVTVKNAHDAGLDVCQGDINVYADTGEQFDVITFSHVIEHLHDPIETLRRAYDLLKPGGIIYVEMPNIDACGHRDFKEHWRGLEIPRHLVIFNWSSAKKCLSDIGFVNISEIYSSFSSYAGLARASRAIRDGNDPHMTNTRKWRDVVKAFYLQWSPFTDSNKSEFITIIAKKPDLV